MKNKAATTDMKQQAERNSNLSQVEQERAQESPDSGISAGTHQEHGHFRTWWSDYQKKMKSAFQLMPLKLEIQG